MAHTLRKNIRLKEYDYSSNGAYFITICTDNRRCLLGDIAGVDDTVRQDTINLSAIGNVVLNCWNKIGEIHPNIKTDKFVIMPNHIHGIITISDDEKGSVGGQSRPPLQKIVQGFKSVSARKCFEFGYKTIWQRSYYEHIIRNEKEYLEIWEYIDTNPRKWQEDKYYSR